MEHPSNIVRSGTGSHGGWLKGGRGKKLHAAVSLVHSIATGPLLLPAPLGWRMLTRSRTAAVHRALLVTYLTAGRRLSNLLAFGLALVVWPFRTATIAWGLTRVIGHQLTHVRSRPAQFLQQLRLAWVHGISPINYFMLGIGTTRQDLDPLAWLQHGHAGLLLRAFRDGPTTPEISDKVLFGKLMDAHRIPTPKVLAVLGHPSSVKDKDTPPTLEGHRAIFVKPVSSFGGQDCLAWERTDEGRWRPVLGPTTSERYAPLLGRLARTSYDDRELLSLLNVWSAAGPLMVQPRLENHRLLPTLGGKGLDVLRVISGLGESGTVVLRAVFCVPYLNSITTQEGLNVSVDELTGVLGSVYLDSIDQRFFRTLGADGPVVEGLCLPFWHETIDCVRRAHLTLPTYPFLGWDVAITPEGPVVLEANGNFGTCGSQKQGPRPLLDEKFLEVFEYQRAQRSVR